MSAAVQTSFLFLLLVTDWAGDPYHGCSPLSHTLGSQEVVCRTVRLPGTLSVQVKPAEPAGPAPCAAALALLPASPSFHPPQVAPAPLPVSLVYIFRSIRR
jgi:hypothetical protein